MKMKKMNRREALKNDVQVCRRTGHRYVLVDGEIFIAKAGVDGVISAVSGIHLVDQIGRFQTDKENKHEPT